MARKLKITENEKNDQTGFLSEKHIKSVKFTYEKQHKKYRFFTLKSQKQVRKNL